MTLLGTDQVIAGVNDLPALPAIVADLIDAIDRQDANLDFLAGKLARDQALAAKVLRLANSSFYGLQRKVTTIHDAIMVLGFGSIRTLVTAAAVTGVFKGADRSVFDFEAFWRHCIGVALAAKALAQRLDVNADSAFTAGLLHDIGRLVLATRFPQHYQAAMSFRKASDCHVIEAENTVLGVNHAIVGHALAQRWRFAPVIQDAIADHHAGGDTEAISLTDIIHIADAISHALDLAGVEDDLVPPILEDAWSQLDLGEREWQQIMHEVEDQFEEICQALTA